MSTVESGYARMAQLFNQLHEQHPDLDPLLGELYDAFVGVDEARTREPRGGVTFNDPLPATWTWQRESGDEVEEAAVVLGVAGDNAAIVTAAGRLRLVPTYQLLVKFQPSGQYRLLLGWAEKGNR